MQQSEASAVQYLPVFCESCQTTRLQPRAEGVAICAACGEQARIVPGGLYRETDVERFGSIDAALRGSAVEERDVRRAAALLSDVAQRRQAPLVMLNGVIDFLPCLRFLLPDTAEEFAALPRVLGMIDTIVGARLRRTRQLEVRPRNGSEA